MYRIRILLYENGVCKAEEVGDVITNINEAKTLAMFWSSYFHKRGFTDFFYWDDNYNKGKCCYVEVQESFDGKSFCHNLGFGGVFIL